MEQNNLFGFINAAFGDTENFSLEQNNSKSCPEYSTSNNETYAVPNYGLSSEPAIPNFSEHQQYQGVMDEKMSGQNPHNQNDGANENVETQEESQIISNVNQDTQNSSQINENRELDTQNPSQTENNKQQEEQCTDEEINEHPTIPGSPSKDENQSTEPDITENTNEMSANPAHDDTNKTVEKDVPNRKKRRRIVLLNDDDDSQDEENDLKKELFEKSSDNEHETSEKSNEASNYADNEAEESDKETETADTAQNRKFLKAKHLLKSAVVIKVPEKKKKKQRVLDSDDENDGLFNTSVDDIGLENCENENPDEEEIFTDNIVILNNDNLYDADGDENLEPTVVNSGNQDASAPDENNKDQKEAPSEQIDNNIVTVESNKEIGVNEQEATAKKTECSEKKEEEENVDAILDKIEPMDDDDDFFKFNDSSDDDEKKNETNEEYFGSPDKPLPTARKRTAQPVTKRARPSQSTKTPPARPRKRGDRYDRDFVDDSESSSYSESISSSESSSSESSGQEMTRNTQSRKPQNIVKNFPHPIQIKSQVQMRPSFTIAHVPTIKREAVKKDRFYDKSRDIPNDVYFGDVKVPLHVLHTKWNYDEQPRKGGSLGPNKVMERPANIPVSIRQTAQPVRVMPAEHDEETKLTVLKEFISICGLKVNYGKLFQNLKFTKHKCIVLRRILAQKGIEGEPTLAKCRELKRKLQAKREIAELDKSVILPTPTRTTRSKRKMQSKDSDTSVGTSNNEKEEVKINPEVLQTLTKIKSVIDSDSD